MRTTHKYKIGTGCAIIEMPEGAKILNLGMQMGVLCIWMIVDPSQPYEERVFTVYGTGHDIEDHHTADHHVGSVQDGPFVWHVFEAEGENQ